MICLGHIINTSVYILQQMFCSNFIWGMRGHPDILFTTSGKWVVFFIVSNTKFLIFNEKLSLEQSCTGKIKLKMKIDRTQDGCFLVNKIGCKSFWGHHGPLGKRGLASLIEKSIVRCSGIDIKWKFVHLLYQKKTLRLVEYRTHWLPANHSVHCKLCKIAY